MPRRINMGWQRHSLRLDIRNERILILHSQIGKIIDLRKRGLALADYISQKEDGNDNYNPEQRAVSLFLTDRKHSENRRNNSQRNGDTRECSHQYHHPSGKKGFHRSG